MLVVGIGAFVLSFILPEKKEKMRDADRKMAESQIKKMLEVQMRDVGARVSDAADEAVTYAMDKTERAMERITNEKIMAINEYSDTVLEAIHKNHEEVVFLYDMLNDKQQSLKDTVAEVEKRTQTALEQFRDAEADMQLKTAAVVAAEPVQEEVPPVPPVITPLPQVTGIELVRGERPEPIMPIVAPEMTKVPVVEERPPVNAIIPAPAEMKPILPVRVNPAEMPAVAISFASSDEEGKNNNERILSLHKAGKSNMAIAKELGLGIGEVKLVIDLFKGV